MQLQRVTKHIPKAQLQPTWHVVDASGQRLGRLASSIATLLQGKHKPSFSRHQLSGDFVIVVNASHVGLSGNKRAQKIYYRHTGYIGHLRERTLDVMLSSHPDRVIELAVKGMLPRNRLGRQMLRRLKVYGGDAHPHEAQVRAGLGKPKAARPEPTQTPLRQRRRGRAVVEEQVLAAAPEPIVAEAPEEPAPEPVPGAEAPEAAPARPRRRRTAQEPPAETKAPPRPRRRGTAAAKTPAEEAAPAKPRRRRKPATSQEETSGGKQGDES